MHKVKHVTHVIRKAGDFIMRKPDKALTNKLANLKPASANKAPNPTRMARHTPKVEKGHPIPKPIKQDDKLTQGGITAYMLSQPASMATQQLTKGVAKRFEEVMITAKSLIPRADVKLPHLRATATSVAQEYSVRNNPFIRIMTPPTPELLEGRVDTQWHYPDKIYGYDLIGYGPDSLRLHDAIVKRTVYTLTQVLKSEPVMPPKHTDDFAYGVEHAVYRDLGVDPWTPMDVLQSNYHGRTLYQLLRTQALKPLNTDDPIHRDEYPTISPRGALEGLLGTTLEEVYPLLQIVAEVEGLGELRPRTEMAKAFRCQSYGPNIEYSNFTLDPPTLPQVKRRHARTLLRAFTEHTSVGVARLKTSAYENVYARYLERYTEPESGFKKKALSALRRRSPMLADMNRAVRSRGVEAVAEAMEDQRLFETALADVLSGNVTYYDRTGQLREVGASLNGVNPQLAVTGAVRSVWMRMLVRDMYRTHEHLTATELLSISLLTGVPVTAFVNYLCWEYWTWELGSFDANLPVELADKVLKLNSFDQYNQHMLADQLQQVDSILALRVADRHRFGITERVLRTSYPLEDA